MSDSDQESSDEEEVKDHGTIGERLIREQWGHYARMTQEDIDEWHAIEANMATLIEKKDTASLLALLRTRDYFPISQLGILLARADDPNLYAILAANQEADVRHRWAAYVLEEWPVRWWADLEAIQPEWDRCDLILGPLDELVGIMEYLPVLAVQLKRWEAVPPLLKKAPELASEAAEDVNDPALLRYLIQLYPPVTKSLRLDQWMRFLEGGQPSWHAMRLPPTLWNRVSRSIGPRWGSIRAQFRTILGSEDLVRYVLSAT